MKPAQDKLDYGGPAEYKSGQLYTDAGKVGL